MYLLSNLSIFFCAKVFSLKSLKSKWLSSSNSTSVVVSPSIVSSSVIILSFNTSPFFIYSFSSFCASKNAPSFSSIAKTGVRGNTSITRNVRRVFKEIFFIPLGKYFNINLKILFVFGYFMLYFI